MLATDSTIFLLVSADVGQNANRLAKEDPGKITLMVKYYWIQSFLYQFAVTMPKYSALLFYIRLFGVKEISGIFRKNILAAFGLVTIWTLLAVVVNVVQCTPVQKMYRPFTPGHCAGWGRALEIAGASSVIDVYIMLLPVPILWSLQAGRTRKMMLTGFFFCAYW